MSLSLKDPTKNCRLGCHNSVQRKCKSLNLSKCEHQ